MKYPITPEFLEAVPEPITRLYQDLEDFVLADICRRFRTSGEATESAIEQIRILQRRGIDLTEIEKRIRETLNLTEKEYDEIFQRAVERNQAYFDFTIQKSDVAVETFRLLNIEREVDAIRRQTQEEFVNLTQSMGFAVRGSDGKVHFLSIAKTYQTILDDAEMQVMSGAVDYNTAIRNAVRRLTDSGLQTVDYATGWHNHVDVAARRAVMTGVSQMSAQYSEQIAEILDTPLREVTAHSGARDVDKPNPWSNHKRWQGRVYAVGNHPRYPNIYDVCGWGQVDGLEGANCRHKQHPFVEGVSERTYTDEQLEHIDDGLGCTFEGRKYTAYQATQKQRQIETAMRECKRRLIAFDASGDSDAYNNAASRLRLLSAKYKQFSSAAGLRKQPERAMVQGFGVKEAAKARRKSIVNSAERRKTAG